MLTMVLEVFGFLMALSAGLLMLDRLEPASEAPCDLDPTATARSTQTCLTVARRPRRDARAPGIAFPSLCAYQTHSPAAAIRHNRSRSNHGNHSLV